MKIENHLITSGKNTLVVGLNKNGEIIQFNRACQKITGYSREQVLYRKICDFLIPRLYIKQWKDMFDSLVEDGGIDNFKIPWRTYDGKEISISWSGFLLKNERGLVTNVCFISKDPDITIHKKISTQKIEDKQDKKIESKKDVKQVKRSTTKDRMTLKTGEKNITFEKKMPVKFDRSVITTQKIVSHEDEKPLESSYRESTTTDVTVKELWKKYEKLNLKLRELEKKDRRLERNNKKLEKNLKNIKSYISKNSIVKGYKKSKHENITTQKNNEENALSEKWPDFLHDPFRIKIRREKIGHGMNILDEREKEIEKREVQLIKDRKDLDRRVASLSTWKEKLVNLESEIERRRKVLVEQEKVVRINQPAPPQVAADSGMHPTKVIEGSGSDETMDQNDHHDILDKIPQSAVVVQRGILKQINSSFAKLIGFETDELVNKSLFDFIAPEGLLDIEGYYFRRLKGEDTSSYETVFSTRDDHKIAVEVSIKPTIFNGEKAEIAVIKEVADMEDSSIAASELEDKKEEVTTVIDEVEDKADNSVTDKVEDKKDNDVTTSEIEDKQDADAANSEVEDKNEDSATDEGKKVKQK